MTSEEAHPLVVVYVVEKDVDLPTTYIAIYTATDCQKGICILSQLCAFSISSCCRRRVFFRPTLYRFTFRGHIHSAFLTFLILIPALFGEEYNLATDVQWGFRIRSHPAATTENNGA